MLVIFNYLEMNFMINKLTILTIQKHILILVAYEIKIDNQIHYILLRYTTKPNYYISNY